MRYLFSGSKFPRLAALSMAVSMIIGQAALAPTWAKESHSSDATDTKKGAIQTDDATSTQHFSPCISWINPLFPPRIALLCIHGLGLYSGSYRNFGMRMAHHRIATYAIDVRGFGSWMKSQGHEQVNFKDCLLDIKQALISIRAANPGMPVFILGESMGGAIALRTAAEYPDLIEGLISSVPAGSRFHQKKTDLKIAFESLKGPSKQFDIGKDIVGQATSNAKLAQDWSGDPLDRMDLSPKELVQFQRFMNENHDSAKNVKEDPVLFVQGTDDKLVKPEGTWELFNEVASPEKTFLAVPSEHLIFEEEQDRDVVTNQRIVNNITSWIFSHEQQNGSGSLDQVFEPKENSELKNAIEKLVQAEYQPATSILTRLSKNQPGNSEMHYWLGIALSKTGQMQLSKREFQTAFKTAATNTAANPAAPATEALLPDSDTKLLSSVTNQMPTVIAFGADWADQCNKLDKVLTQSANLFGDRVKFLRCNVDDPKNLALVQTCQVGPIPTVVFLKGNGKVSSISIGQSSFINFAEGVSTLLR